ncbi:MAG: hypothetical protein M3526_05590, partial [Actinomycetota bacterium]|nr:hypothetical protein [Actinomycetota bacterium]
LEDLIVIELLMARDVLATARVARDLGAGTGAALRTVEETIDATLSEPSPSDIHRSVRAAMFQDVAYEPHERA